MKFKLRAALIAPLTAAGIIDGAGNMVYRVPYKANRISSETLWEVTFNPATHTLQTDNEYAASVMRLRKSPNVKVDGAWYIDDGTLPWFDELGDGDPDPTVVLHTDGTEAISKKEKHLVNKYVKHSGAGGVPAQRDRTTMDPHVATARSYFAGL
jgi:hypothetical protein